MSDITNPYSGAISPGTPSSEVDAATLDGASLSTDETLANNSDVLIPSEKAVKQYVDGLTDDLDDRIDDYELNVAIDGSGNVTIPNTLTVEDDVDITGDLDITGVVGITGSAAITTNVGASTLSLSKADGTTPMTITSTTKVDNLNVDQVDGCDVEDNDSLGTSDVKIPTQGNVKEYVDTAVASITGIISKEIDNADSTYAITDADMAGFDVLEVNTTDGAVILTLPDRATNNGKKIKIKHSIQDASLDIVTINRAGSDTITQDALTSIILPRSGNYIEMFASSVTGNWEILDEAITCELFFDTANAYGTTQNKIIRYTNLQRSIGNLITENHTSGYDGGAEGLVVSPIRAGKYAINMVWQNGSINAGISKNADAVLTTVIDSIAVNLRLALQTTASAGHNAYLGHTGNFSKGDKIRPHIDGGGIGTASRHLFSITYLGQ